MYRNVIIVPFFSAFLLSSCGGGGSEEKIVQNIPNIVVPSALTKLNSKAFYVTKNTDGTYTTLSDSWVVPPRVTSVRITGCSGGNGGAGGGAGGAGAKFFDRNWSGASWGGNGSAGGDANGIGGSGGVGQVGLLGRYTDNNGQQWYEGTHTSSNGGIKYPQADSATQPGNGGGNGEQTIFGNYIFLPASDNKNNDNNIAKIKSLVDLEEVCLGGAGGAGGAGGLGGKAESDLGNNVTRQFFGGVGGRGGNGQIGFHAMVAVATINVTPGETIPIQVGVGGSGGVGSSQIASGQSGSFGSNGQNGNPGANGASGKPGALVLEWVGE